MLQQDKPDDYVIATGDVHSVGELVELAFSYAGLDWREYINVDEKLYRPAEINKLIGDFSKARKALGWKPSLSFEALIKMMVDADMKAFKNKHITT